MKVILSLPLPFDAWCIYKDHIKRFCDTFKQFPPGHDYELWAMCNWGVPTDEVGEWFYGIKTRFVFYYDNGCDLGGHQWVGTRAGNDKAFVIGMTSRCYFHREGWLAEMMGARKLNGPGLYGCSASYQGGKLHLCTRAFGMDASLWQQYPHLIDSREKGPFFEVGTNNPDGNLLEWVNNINGNVFVVHWDEVFRLPLDSERYFNSPGRFRHGMQNAMLVHDYHTDQYQYAGESFKRRLEKMQIEGHST